MIDILPGLRGDFMIAEDDFVWQKNVMCLLSVVVISWMVVIGIGR